MYLLKEERKNNETKTGGAVSGSPFQQQSNYKKQKK